MCPCNKSLAIHHNAKQMLDNSGEYMYIFVGISNKFLQSTFSIRAC